MSQTTFRRGRRDFLRQSGALGLAGAAPLLLSSCGAGGDDATPGAAATPLQDARETRPLHFDLSLANIAEPRLHAARSPQHRALLTEHTADSRALARATLPALASVDDARLTHYIAAVDLPAEALQTIWVMGRDPNTGGPALGAACLSVPLSAQQSVARRAAESPRPATPSAKALAYGIRPTPELADRHDAKALAYGIRPGQVVADRHDTKALAYATRPTVGLADGQDDGLEAFVTNFDTAVLLIFHHPEVMNLNPDLGAEIKSRISGLPCAPGDTSCRPYAGEVAYQIGIRIRDHGLPTTTPGSWATLVPLTGTDGKPALDENGEQVYGFELQDDVAAAVAVAVQQVLKDIGNDPLFKGTNWHETTGLAHQQTDAPKATALASSIAAAMDGAFTVSAGQPIGSTFSGMRVVDLKVTDPATRSVSLSIKNDYLRFVGVFVQYLDSNGAVLPLDPARASVLDATTSNASFLKLMGSNQQLMGIPFQGNDVLSTGIDFTLPAAASAAVVKFGSLGMGGDPFATQEAVLGASLTLALNIGLPTLLLAQGVYVNIGGGLKALFEKLDVLEGLAKGMLITIGKSAPRFATGLYGSGSSNNWVQAVTALGAIALQLLITNMAPLLEILALAIGSAQMLSAAPWVGVAFRVLSMIADAAAIAVSIGEVCSSRAVDDNKITLTMPSTVRIGRDPGDYEFPASASRYVVEATYDGGATPKRIQGTIAKGTPGPIDVPIPDVASGGKVAVSVTLYSVTDCIVGTGKSATLANLPATAGVIPVEIKETLVALNEQTQYQHDVVLTMKDGARAWLPGAAPTRTRADLCAGNDGAICGLDGITVHTATGMAGYGYLAGGQGLPQCGGSGAGGGGGGGGGGSPGPSSGVFHVLQNQFLGTPPDSGYKLLPCGATQPIGIVYDPQSAAVGGRNFFLQPADDGYHIRSVDLTPGTPFDLNQKLSWGRFSFPQDSLVVLPSGFVVGVNRDNHKMEVLQLPKAAVDGAAEPVAVPFAAMKAGLGSRPGLLDTPVAVATARGAVLVLEQGNARIQALDNAGNPVLLFGGGKTNRVTLKAETGAVYLDLGAEGAGYMYVLSYTGSGADPHDYHLDVYTPDGAFLSRTEGVATARIAVDLFRVVYALNYAPVVGATRIEPSVSQWLPSADAACKKSPMPASASSVAQLASCTAA